MSYGIRISQRKQKINIFNKIAKHVVTYSSAWNLEKIALLNFTRWIFGGDLQEFQEWTKLEMNL